MKFEERLSEMLNEVEVPDELSPRNIADMLRERSAKSVRETEKTASKHSAQRRTIIIRTSAAVAACAVLAAGMLAYGGERESQKQLEAPIEYEAISPDSYDSLYNIYTGITLNGGDAPDSERTVDDDVPADNTGGQNGSANDFAGSDDQNVTEADIVKIDGNYMYCLKGSTLCIISLETMEVVSEIESSLEPPVDIYIEGDRLILISKEKEELYVIDNGTPKADASSSDAENSAPAPVVPAQDADIHQSADDNSGVPEENVPDDKAAGFGYSGDGESAIPANSSAASRTNTAVDIYNISDPANPNHTIAYKQNGSYVSSKISDGILYTVTDYSDYRVKPLDTKENLDSFVPAYSLNGEKNYLAAEDIIIPSGAASTDYTVISALDTGSETAAASVKAVLGSGRNAYCSDDTLYVVGESRTAKEYSVISSFDLSDGGITYRSSGSVDGRVLGSRGSGSRSMDEYDGLFRIAAEITDDNGRTSVSVYVLDRSLTVVNSAGQLFPDGRASAVRFERNYARIIDSESGEAVIVLDLSTNPPTLAQSLMGNSAYLCSCSDGMLLGVGKSQDGGLTLTMYSSETGLALNGTVFGEENAEMFSAALTDRRAVLVDADNRLIGVPAYSHNEFGTKNSYYVFNYDENGSFTQKGVIDYLDVDDGMAFKRGYVNDGALYIVSSGRIISARLSDLKIIDTYEY
ncbi:MAG: beta-propeller domain-containing protein [Prevotella sp.]|nr:beta-propeller domain-containing protein [Prevotella sp.]